MTLGAMPGVFLSTFTALFPESLLRFYMIEVIKSAFGFVRSNRPARVLIAYSVLGAVVSVLIPVLSLSFCIAVALIIAIKDIVIK